MLDFNEKPNLKQIIDYTFSLVDSNEPKPAINEESLNLINVILTEMGGVDAFLENYYLVDVKKTVATFDKNTALELDKAVTFFFTHKTALLELIYSYTTDNYKGDIKKMLNRIISTRKYSKKDAIDAMTCLTGDSAKNDDSGNLTEYRRSLILGLVYFVYGHISFNVQSKIIEKEILQKPVEIFGVMHTREEFEALKLDLAS